MTTALIITSLLLLLTFWRYRVWKRRAKGKGFWGLVAREMEANRLNANHSTYNEEWPDFIGQ